MKKQAYQALTVDVIRMQNADVITLSSLLEPDWEEEEEESGGNG